MEALLAERFWPSLLDRLMQEDETAEIAFGGASHPQDDFFLTEADLKKRINRDLGYLLNSVALEVVSDLEGFPRVRKSILNYGIPDLAGRFVEHLQGYELRAVEFQDRLRDAVREFEPRLKWETVKVSVRPSSVDHEGKINAGRPVEFEISGEIWASPVSAVMIDTVMDLQLGRSQFDVIVRSASES